jgi:hypothetical protein
MSFTDAQKVDIRRFCGYPAFGGQPVQAFGHRFYQHYGTLEFRMNNFLPEEEAVVTTYLGNLNTLEAAIPTTSGNLDTAQAAVWMHNPNEQRDRERLYASWRKKLCDFIGVPPGPNFGATGGTVALVV